MGKRVIDYYKELDEAIKSYELHKSWHKYTLDRLADRIDWCWRWRKITESQMGELASRMCEVLKN